MRAVDDPTPMYLDVLRVLRHWGPLPESDVSRLARPWLIITNDLREMEEQGYIDLTFAGDEYVASTATLGRLLLEQDDARR